MDARVRGRGIGVRSRGVLGFPCSSRRGGGDRESGDALRGF